MVDCEARSADPQRRYRLQATESRFAHAWYLIISWAGGAGYLLRWKRSTINICGSRHDGSVDDLMLASCCAVRRRRCRSIWKYQARGHLRDRWFRSAFPVPHRSSFADIVLTSMERPFLVEARSAEFRRTLAQGSIGGSGGCLPDSPKGPSARLVRCSRELVVVSVLGGQNVAGRCMGGRDGDVLPLKTKLDAATLGTYHEVARLAGSR